MWCYVMCLILIFSKFFHSEFPNRHLIVQSQQQNTRTMSEICPEKQNNVWRQWRRSIVFIVNFERISQIFLEFLLLTLNN